MNQIEFFRQQKEILEKLFSTEWFLEVEHKEHPAYRQWKLCKQIIKQNGIVKYPEQKGALPEIARIVLNSSIFVKLTEGNLQQLKFGSLDLYGDEAVQKKIRSRIVNPRQFEDLMVELYAGAWHKTRNHNVHPMEREGFPDLKVNIPGVKIPIFIECKHLWTDSKNRLQKVIKKANKQIKKVREIEWPFYGVVILDVSRPVATGQVVNDKLPNKLQEIIKIVQSALSGKKNQFIGVVILVWDDYMILGNPPGRVLVAVRRRYKRISHKNPHFNIPENLPLFEGYTAAYLLYWTSR